MTCYFHVSSCSYNTHTWQCTFPFCTHFLNIKPMWKFLPELMLWLIADKGREAQEWGIQSSCPGSVSPFYSWAAKLFLSPWILAYKWDSSPPDKPAAPSGGAELRSTGKRGWAQRKEKALQGGGSRRGSSRQSWREALIHALLGSPSKQGRNIRNSWTTDTYRRKFCISSWKYVVPLVSAEVFLKMHHHFRTGQMKKWQSSTAWDYLKKLIYM